MGIYSDIQADLKEAMDDDLADAVDTLNITEKASSLSYDPDTGDANYTPVVYSMRCIIVGPDESDETDPDFDNTNQFLEVMVLDSEKTVSFKLGLEASVRGIDYQVHNHKIDPAGATHSLMLRRI